MLGSPARCPMAAQVALRLWADEHVVPESPQLCAMLENNLVLSVAFADAQTTDSLPDICAYIHWEIPGTCWGSEEKCVRWAAIRMKEPAT